MRNIITLLILAGVTVIGGVIFMSIDHYDEGALLIYAGIILSLLANTQYKVEQGARIKWKYLIYTVLAALGVWWASQQASIAVIIGYVLLTTYLAYLYARTWRKKK